MNEFLSIDDDDNDTGAEHIDPVPIQTDALAPDMCQLKWTC